jgi:hypothetical protein
MPLPGSNVRIGATCGRAGCQRRRYVQNQRHSERARFPRITHNQLTCAWNRRKVGQVRHVYSAFGGIRT